MGSKHSKNIKVQKKQPTVLEIRNYVSSAQLKISLFRNKKVTTIKEKKKAIIECLKQNNLDVAKVKMESIVRDEDTITVFDILGPLCEIVKEKVTYLLSYDNVPVDIKETLDTIIYASTRVEVEELHKFRELIRNKYGDAYINAADTNSDKLVNVNVIERLKVKPTPDAFLVIRLKQLVKESGVNYSFPPEFSEAQMSTGENSNFDQFNQMNPQGNFNPYMDMNQQQQFQQENNFNNFNNNMNYQNENQCNNFNPHNNQSNSFFPNNDNNPNNSFNPYANQNTTESNLNFNEVSSIKDSNPGNSFLSNNTTVQNINNINQSQMNNAFNPNIPQQEKNSYFQGSNFNPYSQVGQNTYDYSNNPNNQNIPTETSFYQTQTNQNNSNFVQTQNNSLMKNDEFPKNTNIKIEDTQNEQDFNPYKEDNQSNQAFNPQEQNPQGKTVNENNTFGDTNNVIAVPKNGSSVVEFQRDFSQIHEKDGFPINPSYDPSQFPQNQVNAPQQQNEQVYNIEKDNSNNINENPQEEHNKSVEEPNAEIEEKKEEPKEQTSDINPDLEKKISEMHLGDTYINDSPTISRHDSAIDEAQPNQVEKHEDEKDEKKEENDSKPVE